MSSYSYHEGPLPPGFTEGYEPALFNTLEFLRLQETAPLHSFYVLNDNKTVVAAIHVQLAEESARSPMRAPFGSVEAIRRINPQVLYDFLGFVERRMRSYGASELVIKNPPRAYDPDFVALLETFLLNLDFVVAIAEPGAVMPVSGIMFKEHIADAQVSRKKQAKRAGLKFSLLPPDHAGEVYDFIASCHDDKGYKLSISRDQLIQAVERFPHHYVLSTVNGSGTMRAAAVSIRVRSNILYNFLVNHEREMNRLSPPILLLEGLYEYCREQNIGLLDLGTSALAGKPNFSLLDFKLRMGAMPTSKFSFYKRIG